VIASLLERVAERLEQRTDPAPSAAMERFPTPGVLARHVRPDTVQTPMLDAVDDAIMQAARGEHRFWIINTPPQEGKSTRLQAAALWFLLDDPSRRIVFASYEQGLAQVSGLAVRQMIETFGSGYQGARDDPDREDVLGLGLDPSRGAATAWRLAQTATVPVPGGVVSVGVGSALTGRPADCVAGDVTIVTEHGPIRADDAFRRARWVLAYDHVSGTARWGYVEARRRLDRRTTVEITTKSGRVLTCTPDHRVHTGRGYVPAGELRPGDTLRAIPDVGGMSLRDYTVGSTAGHPESDHTGPEPVLLTRVCERTTRADAPGSVLRLRRTSPAQPQSDLLPWVPEGASDCETQNCHVRVRGEVQACQQSNHVLLQDVREQGALPADDRHGQLSVRQRAELRQAVPVDAAVDSASRPALLFSVWCESPTVALCAQGETGAAVQAGRPPHQRGRCGQPTGEPDCRLPHLPHDPPQVHDDTVHMVRFGGGSAQPVYDFQVADYHNFFAGGILVHNCLIVDDPIKDAAHADSVKIRKNLKDWWESVASTRLAPTAIVIVVQTRWHEDDLAGWLLTEDDPAAPKWMHLSVSAQALVEDPKAKPPIGPDPFGRAPGEWMVSARGRTPADWEQKRKDIGRGGRWWNAMYQQRPAPPEGKTFQRDWFRRDRVHELPAMRRVVVMVDPADNLGDGDEAGIVVGGITTTGRYVLFADYSGHYTTDGWFRRAFLAYIEHDADALQWEVSLSGLKRTAASTWKTMLAESRNLTEAWMATSATPFPDPGDGGPDGEVIDLAVERMSRPEDSASDRRVQAARLLQLWPYVNRLRALPSTGPYIKQPVSAKGSKKARAELVAPLYENRQVSHLGYTMATAEHEMATWQEGQKSPNRMDAVVHLLRELSRSDGATTVKAASGSIPRHIGIGANRPQIPRSTTTRR
jgi:hypothetical protein